MRNKTDNVNDRTRNIRVVSQIVFSLILIALIKMKRPMNWMVIFLGSAVLSALFSRFYCAGFVP